ncbi:MULTISPECIES: CDP-diacylglycerol--glycerol-3-phosphate 3-phosphatidyltransferase [Hydrocarboniphaga]|jgi:CDP-diacylglycerol--glycerol-3-phosphate 3-phosphatidyltransferase|uniref:CDP-diacylglycerol--glycerol-3-phosphate 3-phosphatidyltransferase n=1 Tax=Hydrocarboniphaga effusa AP103 TaxID=1172194 RepID=I8T2G5_9GAMM|nr:CDP-diacylglycerol--glycerol-3-phosphate 3-phosphatidyltransferase [Hydrocarboniphaga sp.]EIT68100.1 CDP-diacylglycerol--glycerol-3-phosphate 3-phosphatidyltransferase [Hydrocarboniphaga effusa AP103]MDZ4078198.1 CDP-diacylglycerol--glycerol-3-phosphate 3-phosphatidyltransferase [Hydrocarboniphaga sp.]
MNMNLPNLLTVLRVAVIPVVLVLFYLPIEHSRQIATLLYAAACVTDWIDGYLARKWGQTSKFGAFLDPVADKLLVTVTLIMLLDAEVAEGRGRLLAVLVAIIIGREVTISALREWMAELGQRTSVAVGKVGKFKTIFQMVAIGMMLWGIPFYGIPIYKIGFGILFIAAVLTVWSMLLYLKAAWPYMKEDHPL